MALSSGVYDIEFVGKDESKGLLFFNLYSPYGSFRIIYYYDNTFDIDPRPNSELIYYVGSRLSDFRSGILSVHDLGFVLSTNDSDLY
ncbi:hypothetical protein KORDIASMS9_00906 [Kordia sp. SMS9]|uniref:hypothetical protein n=1 Tax=Kordia sp. SMS9 TaxID=2282170 RepID=UPI000E0D1C7E|nr:hypothetical protein [Kordia sp. SMS9]AXG68690.1 hypothetical protein KORDIASMS9_00906 [Kordia sp. SMS9]